jgi:radical SAM protein with 4Fe4S-binding SPASM domain
VRDWYFLCNAGIYVAGIQENGDVSACLDIPRSDKTVQGNVLEAHFRDIWKNRFEIFRTPLSERNEICRECPQKKYCRGGSYHSWDYEKEEPKICFKGILF